MESHRVCHADVNCDPEVHRYQLQQDLLGGFGFPAANGGNGNNFCQNMTFLIQIV
jgi:hypothetical protein